MRTPIRLTVAALAGATLIAGIGAGAAMAEPAPVPDPGPSRTGSSMIDFADLGSSMGSSALQRGDILSALAILVNIPFPILIGGFCDATSMSGTGGEGNICAAF
ncbi:hypothetical protein [Nocardia higoensis]|uniref:hypothetical protein n=1 Tax=Nocardia higoensis TaxID=228599 RepID=UPI0005934606|nr:hypothetical protein [Nocardia higoensis]